MDSARDVLDKLKERITLANLPKETEEKVNNYLKFTTSGVEFDKLNSYIEFILSLPFNKYSEDILDLNRAKQILNKNHYGLEAVKNRILEYLSVLILYKQKRMQNSFHAPILAFVGLVGSGKTTLAYSIAEALGRPIVRIPFGGLGDVLSLRGQSRLHPDAGPGQIIKAIKTVGVSNPVILLDEVDRVDPTHKIEIMGVLVELLDPSQNHNFVDYYLDFPYDLSQVLFIATANNTANIAAAVMDRLEPIQMPSYSDEEKQIIAKEYLLPKIAEQSGIEKNILTIDQNIWPQIIRPLGFDAGIRSLERTLQSICRKIARTVVEGNSGPFNISGENLGEYLNG